MHGGSQRRKKEDKKKKCTGCVETFEFDVKKNMKLNFEENKNLALIEAYDNAKWFLDVAKLGEGQSFGELALISDEPRKANIICLSNCYFATI